MAPKSRLPSATVLALAIGFTSGASWAASTSLNHDGMTLPIPEGYCQPARDQEVDRFVIDAFEAVNEGATEEHALAVLADCVQLARWRKTPDWNVAWFQELGGYFAFTRPDGTPHENRKEFFENITAFYERPTEAEEAATTDPQSEPDTAALSTEILRDDDEVLYVVTSYRAPPADGRDELFVAVTGHIMVRGRALGLVLANHSSDEAITDRLLDLVRKTLRRLIDAN